MFFDLHNDLLTSGMSFLSLCSYLKRHSSINLILAYFTTKETEPLKKFEDFVCNIGNRFNVRFAIEDMHFVNENNLDKLLSLPISYCTLAWKDDNAIAGGHRGVDGITALGQSVIKRLNEKNIVIDTAHINEKSFYEVLERGKRVFNSHTCLSSVHKHSRNLSDEQVRAIISRGGIVGLTPVAEFMTEKNACRLTFAQQIDTFLNKFGAEYLAIGTDFFGTSPIKGLASYKDFTQLRQNLNNFGHNDETIDKIFFKNATAFFA